LFVAQQRKKGMSKIQSKNNIINFKKIGEIVKGDEEQKPLKK